MTIQAKINAILLSSLLVLTVALSILSVTAITGSHERAYTAYMNLIIDDFVNRRLEQTVQLRDTSAYSAALVAAAELTRNTMGNILIFSVDSRTILGASRALAPDVEKSWQEDAISGVQMPQSARKRFFHNPTAHESYVMRYFRPWNWVVIYAIPDRKLSAILMHVTIGSALTWCGLAAATFSILALVFNRFVARPITRLQTYAEGIARGEEPRASLPSGRDEIAALERSLIQMAAAIQESKDDLKHANAGLEQEVERRTQKLEEANRQLCTDVEERRSAERRLSQLVHDRDLLLREVHHGVKNSLFIVHALVEMEKQLHSESDPTDRLTRIQNRIKSIAMIHEHLYRVENFATLNMREYLQDMVAYLEEVAVDPHLPVEIHVSAQDIAVGVDQAVPCGLIVNELVANAMQHAFVGMNGGIITVSFNRTSTSTCVLEVSDNGVGLGGIQPQLRNLGVQLVTELAGQLGAKIDWMSGNGTTCRLQFDLA